jgi:ribosomal protein S18 acetylase RimI-like enzyme
VQRLNVSTMNAQEQQALIALYDQEHRRTIRLPGYETIQTEAVTRCISVSGQAYVFWQDAAHEPAPLIAQEIAWHQTRAKRLTWKLYSHDAPPGFADALLAHGFVCEGPANQFCALNISAFNDVLRMPPGYRMERLHDAAQLQTLIDLYGNIWPDEDNALWLSGYAQPLAHGEDGLHLFCVFDGTIDNGGRAAASGGMIHYAGQQFGHLFGGGTHPQYRRMGLHGALSAVRAQTLRERGGRWLVVDAGDQSYPLLAKRGFEPLGQVSFYSINF